MKIEAIILAAGKGTRMKSALPKVLHRVGGKPLLEHIINTSYQLGCTQPIVICGHGSDQLKSYFADFSLTWVAQTEQLGTGHAVLQTLNQIDAGTRYLILVGDAPLISAETLSALANSASDVTLLTVETVNPKGLGRIIRDANGQIQRIVEEKDANAAEKAITEINSGVYCVKGSALQTLLPLISNDNEQQEYYLTDIIELALANNISVNTVTTANSDEVLACNDRKELAILERVYQRQQTTKLMLAGVTLLDPSRVDVRGEVVVGQDISIDVNCILLGKVSIGNNVRIGANCILKDVEIGDNVTIEPNSMLDSATIGNGATVGPFARIRPKTKLAENSKVGNFVELKNTQLGVGSKINHLSYVGDAVVGESVNVGAGVITCNYDGQNKHQTQIGDGAFIGSNAALVAPVKIGKNVTIGAGSTINKDVSDNSLGIARARQSEINDWKK